MENKEIIGNVIKDGMSVTITREHGYLECYLDGEKLDRFEMLSASLNCDDKKTAFEILNFASILFHPRGDYVFNTLYGAVAFEIARKFEKDELYFQRLFKEKCSSLGLGEIVPHKDNQKHIPDAWINRNGELIPVEVKVSDFNKKALKQLNRYMDVYNTRHGIAVARSLAVELPDNIEFIPFDAFTDE